MTGKFLNAFYAGQTKLSVFRTNLRGNEYYQSFMRVVKAKPFAYTALFAVVCIFLLSNIFFVFKNQYSLNQVIFVLADPVHNRIAIGEVLHGLSNQDYRNISEGLWSVFATLVAGAGLAIAGLAAQSLTKNPLADASTLGLVQGGVFALLVALSYGWTSYYVKFFATIIGIAVSSILLIIIITIGKSRMTTAKVILAGLAIGVVFKTFTFLIRRGDTFLSAVSYNYALGGAESINKSIGNDQWNVLYISAGLTIGGILLFTAISRSLTILELGDEKAKQLGIRVKTIKVISVLILIILIPAAASLVGNLSFVGLFATHLARYFFRTRSYAKLIIPTIFIGVLMSMLGLLITNFVPTINSGIWMTIIGAPYIIYAGLRGLR